MCSCQVKEHAHRAVDSEEPGVGRDAGLFAYWIGGNDPSVWERCRGYAHLVCAVESSNCYDARRRR